MQAFLWDNDIILKSVEWGLEGIFLKFLRESPGKHFHLNACKFIAKRKYTVKENTPEKYEKVKSILECMNPLPEDRVMKLGDQLVNEFKIDTGEALLIQTLQNQEGWMLTGDKKALRELEKIPTGQLDLSFLHGRVIVWEDLLMYFVKNHDWKVIQNSVKSVTTTDTLFKVIFSPHNQKKKEFAIEAIQSYQKENFKEFKKYLLSPTKIKKVLYA